MALDRHGFTAAFAAMALSTMRTTQRNRWLAALAALALLLPVRVGAAIEYRGRAFGALLQVPSVATVRVVDTDELPPEGGARSAFAVDQSVAVASESLWATSVPCSTRAGAGKAHSSAETQGLDLRLHVLLQGARVTATLVRAEVQADCATASGSSVLVDLKIDGTPVVVTGVPNQSVGIPGVATLVINEQISSGDGTGGDKTVNALHVYVLNGVQVIVSSAHSGVRNCPPLAVSGRSWTAVKCTYR
jgi:hypothetical protein